MEEENEVKWDKSRWLIMALVVVICWLMFRKIVRNAVRRMWLRLDSFLLDQFSVNYNKRMHSRKKALLFDGLSQMTRDAGRPLRVLEVGVGTGANFAYYPDGTTVACVDPSAEYSDRLQKNAERFPGIHLELHRGFAEDMAMIESGSIDAVTSTMVMCCVRDIDKCLKEIIRILRPVGIKCTVHSCLIIFFTKSCWLSFRKTDPIKLHHLRLLSFTPYELCHLSNVSTRAV